MANRTIEKKYISIDSNILRAFVYLDVLINAYKKKNNESFVFSEIEDDYDFTQIIDLASCNEPLLRRHPRNMSYLYVLFKKDKLRMYVTEAVYNENKHSATCRNFIRDNCFMHKQMTELEKDRWLKKVTTLVKEYTSPQQMFIKGELVTCNPPMKVVHLEHLNSYVPTNDCYIMAESTVDNCLLLTGNGKDFIFDVKEKEFIDPDTQRLIKKKSRTIGIVDINLKNGYYYTNEEGFNVVPKPIDIDTFANAIRKHNIENFDAPKVNKEDTVYAVNRIGF